MGRRDRERERERENDQSVKKICKLHTVHVEYSIKDIISIMLLHPCECNIQFKSTKPEGKVLVNQILHEQDCNNKFVSH